MTQLPPSRPQVVSAVSHQAGPRVGEAEEVDRGASEHGGSQDRPEKVTPRVEKAAGWAGAGRAQVGSCTPAL